MVRIKLLRIQKFFEKDLVLKNYASTLVLQMNFIMILLTFTQLLGKTCQFPEIS